MEDMESLNKLVDENIADCLRMISTHTEIGVRQSFGRCLLRALQQPIDLVIKDICAIVSTLLVVSEDKEVIVRTALLGEIPEILYKCRELAVDDLDIFLFDRLVDILLLYLEDVDPQLRKNTFYSVKHLLEKSVFDKAQLLGKICPGIVGLSNLPFKNHDVDYYTNAIELMAQLASIIGLDDTQTHLLDRFCKMCEDEVYSIRRWCADYMPVFCHVLCETITEARLLPIFKLLCEDGVWGVRKSAAKSLPKIALICSLQRRHDVLAPIAFDLLNDSSRFVSESAFKNLGQFIATFAQPCVIELEYGSTGKLYITSKSNDTKSQNSFTEDENVLPTQRRDESCSILESIEQNPFRMFLTGEPFCSIQAICPMELMNLNMTSLQRVNKNVFEKTESCKTKRNTFELFNDYDKRIMNERVFDHPTESSKVENMEYEDQKWSDCLSDVGSSSGCSSASSTNGCDDNANSEDVIKMDIVTTENLSETKISDSDNEKCDLNDNTNIGEEYTDDFYDNFPNDILNQLPDGLREVIAQIRANTHADIRKRNKESRVTMYLMKDQVRERKRLELRSKLLGKPTKLFSETTPPVTHSHHPCVDIGGLTKPLIIFPWRLRAKANHIKSLSDQPNTDTPSKEISTESDSNILVIDNTNVTLRKKRSSKIFQNTVERNENMDADEELKEFNSHNYWYISPTFIDIDNELKTLAIPEAKCETVRVVRKKCSSTSLLFDIPPAADVSDNGHKLKLDKLKASCVGPTQKPESSFFNQPIVPPYLIEYFVSMEHFADSDFNMYCVYNFPAVVLTLKKEHWYLMYDLLLFLAGDIQWKVRKTIAMFICDIAVIIGRENTHRDLMPIFLGFFKDLDEVKIEALKNLPMFLSVVDVEEHPKVIANLVECLQCDNDSNWRFREELARQLLHLIKTYGHVYRVDYMICVTGMAIMLLTDKVSAVRTVAMDAIAEKFCSSTEIEFKYLVEFLVEDFARHVHWRRRQMFINICEELINKKDSPPIEVIEINFLPHILELAQDKIPNIRLAVVRLLSLLITLLPQSSLELENPIMQTMKILQNDVDNDVSFVANNCR